MESPHGKKEASVCLRVLIQTESGPKFNHVMRAKLTEVGSNLLTQTLFLQIHGDKVQLFMKRNQQSHRELCAGS